MLARKIDFNTAIGKIMLIKVKLFRVTAKYIYFITRAMQAGWGCVCLHVFV